MIARITDPDSAGLTSVAFAAGDAVITADGNGGGFLWSVSGQAPALAAAFPDPAAWWLER